ncbi:alpha/beta fold hydrolase [Nitrospirillum sp. BR 11752]|uniref:alpha/beta fold hydrolase n=1 Tax=Nitrospirillum sp. BR 11752 TaxID=3104293 RepID=UPI002EB37C83|nr:alpha/beta fold hydrolase [Nitrospirillum sp. BR 11752]
MAVLLNSQAGLPLLNGSSPIWRKELEPRCRQLRADLAGVDPEALKTAVERETRRRLDTFLSGLERYRRAPYQRDVLDPPPIWTEGNSRLLDYSRPGAKGPVLLFVPSLVNRGYILDLSARKSLVRWLAQVSDAQGGFRPLLLDWGSVGATERGFGLSDYVAGRLARAVDATRDLMGQTPALVGYCMGGTLAAAAAVLRPEAISSLVLLAAPWDFHADDAAAALRTAAVLPLVEPALTWLGELPVDMIQFLFAGLDPLLALRKFSRYAHLDPDSQDAQDFVALEDWLNDGVPLAAAVARECLGGWYGRNDPAQGNWRMTGRAITPEAIRLPTLAIIPARDRIVPPGAARALIDAIPGGDRLEPPLGHIGMVVSAGAPAQVWAPLAEWLRARLQAPRS